MLELHHVINQPAAPQFEAASFGGVHLDPKGADLRESWNFVVDPAHAYAASAERGSLVEL